MDNFEIRRLAPSDIDQVSCIYSEIIGTPVDEEFRQFIAKQAARKENISFVAELQGNVIGFMISSIHSGIFGIKRSAWISFIGVDPRYMGQGIGEQLGRRILTEYQAQGVKEIYTSVRWDSADILSFFKNLGFDHSNFINLRKSLD